MSAPLALRLTGEGVEPAGCRWQGGRTGPSCRAGRARALHRGRHHRVVSAARFRSDDRGVPRHAPGCAGAATRGAPAARAHVDEVFLSVPLPPAVADAVDRLVAEVAGAGRVAVRSSATAEDLGSASFAGQYESYLNVEPADAHDAVRKVWASMWYPSPRWYRWFRGIEESDLAMAAVVMRMLDPSIAGVMFTVDPGGKPNAVRLEVVEGLGEQLVSGAVTPDAHVLDREDLVYVVRRDRSPAGGPRARGDAARGGAGAPQDIEFAVHHDELFLVQARPITTAGDDTTTTTASTSRAVSTRPTRPRA